jgi:cytochrome P450
MTDGMLALLEHPEQLAVLRDDPGAIEVAVEELLRWVSPIKNMARTVTSDIELHDQTLHEGDQVILVYPSANRDAAVFDHADEFDVRRDPNPHLAFGFGPHFCMGASLARIELKVMFSELLRRLPDLHLAGEPLPRRASNSSPVPKRCRSRSRRCGRPGSGKAASGLDGARFGYPRADSAGTGKAGQPCRRDRPLERARGCAHWC